MSIYEIMRAIIYVITTTIYVITKNIYVITKTIYPIAKTIYTIINPKVTPLPAYYLLRKEVNTYFLSIRFPTIPTIFPIVKAARTVPIPSP